MKEEANEHIVVVRIRVTGRVQGVGFRAWASKRAARLDLSGTAENQDDGSVLIEMRGNRAAIDRYIELCRRGPESSRVDGVQVTMLT